MSTSDRTTDEIIDSLTGHDEWAISRNFGVIISELVDDQTMLRRACIFILKKRDGDNEDDARNAALDLTLAEVLDYFAVEGDASGKDETESEPQPDPSPSGALEPDEASTTT